MPTAADDHDPYGLAVLGVRQGSDQLVDRALVKGVTSVRPVDDQAHDSAVIVLLYNDVPATH
jgi:hypothetical protein